MRWQEMKKEKNPQNYTANDKITCLIIMCVQYPWSDAISDFYRSYSNWFYGRRRTNNWVRGVIYTHFMIEVINCKPAYSLKCMRSMSLLLSAQNIARTYNIKCKKTKWLPRNYITGWLQRCIILLTASVQNVYEYT